jgi:hypothetical protein
MAALKLLLEKLDWTFAPMVDVAPRCSLRKKLWKVRSGEDPFFRSKLPLPEQRLSRKRFISKYYFSF